MFSILFGIIGIGLSSIGAAYNSRALKTTQISSELFKLCCYVVNVPIMGILLYMQGGLDSVFLDNGIYAIIILIATIFAIGSTLLGYYVIRQTKVSYLLPYQNLDKLFIVLIGFVLYYGGPQQASITTLSIAIFTIFITLISSIDIRNISFSGPIKLFFLTQLLKAFYISGMGYVLLHIEMITFASVLILFEIILYSLLTRYKKIDFRNMMEQSRSFYIQRGIGTTFAFSAWLISAYLIKDLGIVIATLLGFFGIAFSIFSNRIILKDTATPKQIILALTIIVLIGIGYYFK